MLRVLENDLILKHDCIWPHGLNFRLSISSLLEVSEFRKSCLRHHWPPNGDISEGDLDLPKLRQQVLKAPISPTSSDGGTVPSPPSSDKSCEVKPERPKSAKAATPRSSKPSTSAPAPTEAPAKSPRPTTPRKLPATPKSPVKRPQSASAIRSTAKEDRPASVRKTQRTPEPVQDSTPEEEQDTNNVIKEARPSVTKSEIPAPSASKISPTEECVTPRLKTKEAFEANGASEEAAPEQPDVQQSPEEPAGSPLVEKASSSSAEVDPDEDPKPPPLKRTGTYEILPTEDDDELVENSHNGPASKSSDEDVDGECQESGTVAARPRSLERQASRLPVSKN